MLSLTTEVLVLLFGTALLAGAIDAVAGGGGMLTLPALLSAGLPPAMALGTNKLQGCFSSLAASIYFLRKGMVDWRRFWPAVVAAAVGGACGALTVQQLDPGFLRQVIPWLLIAIATYMLLARSAGEVESHQRVSLPVFAVTAGFGVGFYDGFFGPGTGTFFAIACVSLLGASLTRATAHSKLMNFACNLGALIFFIIGGKILWLPGGIMAVGQFIGGQLGARIVLRGGTRLVRWGVIVMSLILSVRLFLTG